MFFWTLHVSTWSSIYHCHHIWFSHRPEVSCRCRALVDTEVLQEALHEGIPFERMLAGHCTQRWLLECIRIPAAGSWERLTNAEESFLLGNGSSINCWRSETMEGTAFVVWCRVQGAHVQMVLQGILPRWLISYHSWSSIVTLKFLLGTKTVPCCGWLCPYFQYFRNFIRKEKMFIPIESPQAWRFKGFMPTTTVSLQSLSSLYFFLEPTWQ